MTEWKVIKLGDVADIIGGGTPDTKNDSYWGGDVPWLTPKDLSGYGSRHISKGERNISYQGLTNSSAKMLPVGSVLLTSRAPIGYVAIAKNQLCTNQGFKSLVLKENADSEFFYYLLKNNVDYIQGMSSGSTFAEISGSQVKALEFKIPSLDVQKRIAGILGALDDRIDVLRRENVVLEQMAQAVFQSWFVDFDIVRAKAAGTPESEVCEKYHITPELYALFPSALTPDNLPLGWEKKSLPEIATYLNGLPLQKFPPKNEDEFLPVIKIAELKARSVVGADKASTDIDSKYIIDDGDVIFSWSGSLAVDIWCCGKGALNQHLFKVFSSDYPKWFYYLWTKSYLFQFQQIAAGKATTMGHIQRAHLEEAKANVPSEKILEVTDKIICPLIEKIIENSKQIRALSATRDALLPKLMNDEIEVLDE